MNKHKDYSRNERPQNYQSNNMKGRTKGSRFASDDYDRGSHDMSSNYGSASERENHGQSRFEGQSNYGFQDRYTPDHMQNHFDRSSSSMTGSQYGYGQQYDQQRNPDYRSGSSSYGSNDLDRSQKGASDYLYNQDFTGRQYSGDRSMNHQSSQQYGSYGHDRTSGSMVGKGPKGYRRSDERVREDVCDALSQHGNIDASDVEVKVSEGTVTLSGTISSRQMKRMIEDVSESISGVQDVKNDIRVQSSMNRSETQDSLSNPSEKMSPSGKGSSTQTDKPGKH